MRAITGDVFGGPLIAAGDDDGAPLLVAVDGPTARAVPDPDGQVWGSREGGYSSVVTDGELLGLVSRADPSALLLHHEDIPYPPQHLRDARGREASWVVPLLDGEENTRAVGAVRTPDGWRLHAWQAWDTWLALDVGEQLHLPAEPSSRTLLAGTTEVEVVVAGAVSDRPGSVGAAPQVWSLSDDRQAGGSGRWVRHPTATALDGVTDLAYWDLGWWVAGHRDGRPIVDEGGVALPVPDTRLDPDHPMTIVAGIPLDPERPLVLATQSVDGPALWVDEGGSWSRSAAPPGRLSAAQVVADDVYVVVDGELWFRPLPTSTSR